MKNMFENAYFGKPYRTRDGRKARFVINMGEHYGHPYRLVIEGENNFFNYDEHGMMTDIERGFDIVSEWQEEENVTREILTVVKKLVKARKEKAINQIDAYDKEREIMELVDELVEVFVKHWGTSTMANIWHKMDEEPLRCGVILFSDRPNRIYDASYIGEGCFDVNGLIVDKSNFDCWCQRGDFFKETNLRAFMRDE